MIRKVQVKNKNYTLTFDSEGVLDTVTDESGKLLHGGQAIVQRFVKYQTELRAGYIPANFDAKFV